ncbi:hypothetical protein Tco_1026129 [Tanacetum coccineum]
MKAKFALLEASSSTPQAPNTFQPKNKGLVAKTFDYDEEEVIDDEDVRILQKSQENGQIRTNTDTGMDKCAKSGRMLSNVNKSHP